MNNKFLNPSPRNKILFYIDLREVYSNCSSKKYLSKISKKHFWTSYFQSIILFHFHKNCSTEYEIWTRAPWSEKPGEKIENIKQAYFNKKPNLQNAVISFYSTIFELRNSREENRSTVELFQKIWFEKWNMVGRDTTNKPPVWHALILVEPAYMERNADAYSIMSMCFVVQKGKDRPKWEAIIWCFHWKVWLLLTVMWFISGLAWYFLNKQNSLTQSLSQMNSLIITEPIFWLPSLNSNSQRFMTGLLMLMSIVIITGFQSNLYKNMQVPPVYPSINEIKQIKDQNLTIICTYPFSCYMIFGLAYGFENNVGKLFKAMSSQYIEKNQDVKLFFLTFHTLNDVFSQPDIALITPCESARLMINKIRILSKNLHVVEETITSFPLYYENFPFDQQLHQLLLSYFASGIGQWAEHITHWNKLITILFREKREPPVKVFSMDDLQIGFIFLFIGLSISTFIFILECISTRWLASSFK